MFGGSMVAIATPMQAGVTPDTPLDNESLARLIRFHLENQTDAIVAVGTTGESATLNVQEHSEVIRRIVDLVGGHVPVIAGTGANSTSEAIHLTQAACGAGVDACLLVTPYYNKPTQEGLYRHYKAVAEAVDIPQILYNVPGRTGCDLLPETVIRLSGISNIIGVKEATADMDRIGKIRARCHEGFLLLSGDDATACDFVLRGGDGVISVTANVAPKAMHDMCVAAAVGDADAACQINRRIALLHEKLFIEANPIPVKWALYKMGFIQEGIRLPLTWLSDQYHKEVFAALREAGCVEN